MRVGPAPATDAGPKNRADPREPTRTPPRIACDDDSAVPSSKRRGVLAGSARRGRADARPMPDAAARPCAPPSPGIKLHFAQFFLPGTWVTQQMSHPLP